MRALPGWPESLFAHIDPCEYGRVRPGKSLGVTDRQRVGLFAALAGVAFAVSAPVVADSSIRRGFIVIPLIAGAIFLFLAGYYSGLARQR